MKIALSKLGVVLVAFVAVSISTADIAKAGVPTFPGVWGGTLGKQKIIVCFDAFGSSYYYLGSSAEPVGRCLSRSGR